MEPKRILMAHNFYQIHGGEEESFRAEMSLLLQNGHDVIPFTRDNADIQSKGVRNKLDLFSKTIWSKDSYWALVQIIRQNKPQLVHFQNTFPLISPSAYYACKREGVPVVQSLRNYRLMCPNGFFFRDGKPCEDCKNKFFAWPGIVHACYRQSRLQTSVVAAMLSYHRVIKTWESMVDVYVALTEFSRGKFIEAGLPSNKIVVKPNYIPDPGIGSDPGEFAVYVGRLSSEKGIEVLLRAWKQLSHIPLKILGEGPLTNFAQSFIHEHGMNAILLGRLPNEVVMNVVKKSAFLVFPSILYETFGRTIVEAFACGKPVIASYHGTAVELISNGSTGLFFEPGNSSDLAEKVLNLWETPERMKEMGNNARIVYEEKYSKDKNYRLLVDIYKSVLNQ